jgi:hypothetical protein
MTFPCALRVALVLVALVPGVAGAQATTSPSSQQPATNSGPQPVPTSTMPAPPPKFYATALVGTTLAFRPEGGTFAGPQKDMSPMFGAGYFLSPQVALELDAGPTLSSGHHYSSFSLMPGLVWAFNPKFYAAARFAVLVDPEANFAIFPGLGFITPVTKSSSLSVYVETNLWRNVGRGPSDSALGVTLGLLRTF